tara:strand:+ start:181 stop:429 length:249 start_codon:yes stop_codon:yes gene_type:complete
MEYVVGPLLTMLISLGYTQMRHKDCKAKQLLIEEKIENVEVSLLETQTKLANYDTELARKVVGAVIPLSKSLKDLKEFTGMQ